MSDIPIEYETARVSRFASASGGVKIIQNKFGQEVCVNIIVGLTFLTTLHKLGGWDEQDNPKLSEDCMRGQGCSCGQMVGQAQFWNTRAQTNTLLPRGGVREVKSALEVPRRYNGSKLVQAPELALFNNFGPLENMPDFVTERLKAELCAVVQGLEPDIEKARKRVEKSRQRRLTGPGAEERIGKMKAHLQKSLKKVPPDINAEIIMQIILLHTEYGCFMTPGNGGVWFKAKEAMEAMKKPGMPSYEDLLTQAMLWEGGSGRAMGDFLSHCANNPLHVELLKLEHIAEAIDLASVAEIMER